MKTEPPIPDQAQRAQLETYLEIVLRENKNLNLTGDATPELFRSRHLDDGWLGWAAMERAGLRPEAGSRGLDIGSGAGLPGVILAVLWPQVHWTLLDARRKRTDFLVSLAGEMGLANVDVVCGRVESLAHEAEFRERFAFVTARAVAPMPTLAELTLPFVCVGGIVAAFKAEAVEEEVEQARGAIEILGGAGMDPEVDDLPYERPDGKRCRILVVRKMKSTPEKYPRRDGMPAKRPL